MATTKISIISQGYTEATANGTSQYVVTKRCVFDTAYDISVFGEMQVVKAAAFGDCYTLLATSLASNELGRMRIRSVSVSPVPGSADKIFDVIARYDTLYSWVPLNSLGAYSSTLSLPVDVSMDCTPRQVTMYRSPTFGTSPSANLNGTTDIGGTKVDYAAKPVQALVPSVRFSVSMVFDTKVTTLVTLYDDVATATGCWNSAAFMHWGSANQVYCESGNISHIRDEFYRVSFVFVWDQWYGCEQVPKTDVSGNAAVDSNGSATTVTWKSLVRNTYNHNNIFNHREDSALAKQIALEGSWLTYP
jgi:hypothetical protein